MLQVFEQESDTSAICEYDDQVENNGLITVINNASYN
jgi:hypothetical protein